jgi:chlorophyll synthase
MLLSGLLITDHTKITKDFNDFYDREIDVINEPYRPILSGAISVPQVVTQIIVLLGVRLALKYALDIWAGYVVSNDVFFDPRRRTCGLYLLSPPLKLKQNSCLGNYTLGTSYIALPWWVIRSCFSWKLKLNNCDLNPVL